MIWATQDFRWQCQSDSSPFSPFVSWFVPCITEPYYNLNSGFRWSSPTLQKLNCTEIKNDYTDLVRFKTNFSYQTTDNSRKWYTVDIWRLLTIRLSPTEYRWIAFRGGDWIPACYSRNLFWFNICISETVYSVFWKWGFSRSWPLVFRVYRQFE